MATETEVKLENGVKAEPVADAAAAPVDGAQKKPRKRNNRKKRATEGGEANPATETAEGVAAPEAIVHDNTAKVFVGNLSFETTQQEIEEIFGKAGKIAEVNIITRGERSLGYGFISYENDTDANQAVATLDKTEIAGRQINVERAQDKDAKPARGRASRGRGGVARRGGRAYSRGGGRAGHEDGAARVDGEDGVDAAAETEEGEEGEGGRGRGRAPRGRRFSKTPRPARTGETSSTMLFVANLPFRFKDEDLAAVFNGYAVQSAKVVVMRSGRSKGFGFVTLASPEEQQKVLKNIGTPVADERELVIKVAMANQTAPAESAVKTEETQ